MNQANVQTRRSRKASEKPCTIPGCSSHAHVWYGPLHYIRRAMSLEATCETPVPCKQPLCHKVNLRLNLKLDPTTDPACGADLFLSQLALSESRGLCLHVHVLSADSIASDPMMRQYKTQVLHLPSQACVVCLARSLSSNLICKIRSRCTSCFASFSFACRACWHLLMHALYLL